MIKKNSGRDEYTCTHVVGSEISYGVLSWKTHYRFDLLEQEVIIIYLKY